MTRSDIAFGDLDAELETTRRTLERIPAEHLEWAPHEKSMTLAGLATHITNVPGWQAMILSADGFDMAGPRPPTEPATTVAEVLDAWDAKVAELHSALESIDEAALGDTWSLTSGEEVLFSGPRAGVFRRMGTSHLIHHRAQLGVYFRLLDHPVPSMYGPSADEQSF